MRDAPGTAAIAGPDDAGSADGRLQDFLGAHAPVLSIAAFFVVICAVFALATDAFLSERNLLNLLRQSAPLLIVAVAMTFVITTGGIDLSVGSILALVNALAAIALQAGIPWPLRRAPACWRSAPRSASSRAGSIACERIPAFIVTLAGAQRPARRRPPAHPGLLDADRADSWFVEIGRGWVLGVPLPAVIAVVVALGGLRRADPDPLRPLRDRRRRQCRGGAARRRRRAPRDRRRPTC